MQIWIVDKDGYWIDNGEKNENSVTELDITEQPVDEDGSGFYKAKWDFVLKKWVEGATQDEIAAWKEANNKPSEPSKVEALTARVDGLENINAGLLLENAEHQINIQEQEKMNKEQEVTNANLLLEIAILKGAML